MLIRNPNTSGPITQAFYPGIREDLSALELYTFGGQVLHHRLGPTGDSGVSGNGSRLGPGTVSNLPR